MAQKGSSALSEEGIDVHSAALPVRGKQAR